MLARHVSRQKMQVNPWLPDQYTFKYGTKTVSTTMNDSSLTSWKKSSVEGPLYARGTSTSIVECESSHWYFKELTFFFMGEKLGKKSILYTIRKYVSTYFKKLSVHSKKLCTHSKKVSTYSKKLIERIIFNTGSTNIYRPGETKEFKIRWHTNLCSNKTWNRKGSRVGKSLDHYSRGVQGLPVYHFCDNWSIGRFVVWIPFNSV